eukprot:scaffold285659_cov33-Tisochrysis_lutea.AAC.1
MTCLPAARMAQAFSSILRIPLRGTDAGTAASLEEEETMRRGEKVYGSWGREGVWKPGQPPCPVPSPVRTPSRSARSRSKRGKRTQVDEGKWRQKDDEPPRLPAGDQ